MSETADFSIREATLYDAARIAGHRVANFRAMGQIRDDQTAAQLLCASLPAIEALMRSGDYRGWLAVDPQAAIIGGAGVHSTLDLPRPRVDGDRIDSGRAHRVVNVYTEPAWRRRGVAKALLDGIMAWARAEGIDRVLVYASEEGRALYGAANFVPTTEMSRPTGGRRC